MAGVELDDARLDWTMLVRVAEAAVTRYITATPLAAHLRDELTSDALLGMVRAVPRWDPDLSSAATYLAKKAWWAVVDGQRNRLPVNRTAWAHGARTTADIPPAQRPAVSLDVLAEHALDPGAEDPALAGVEDDDATARLLSPLSPRQRDVVVRTVLGGELLREVATDYGVTESAVYQLRKRALRTMRANAETDQTTSSEQDAAA